MKVSIDHATDDRGIEFRIDDENGTNQLGRVWITTDGIRVTHHGKTDPENRLLFRWETLLDIARFYDPVKKGHAIEKDEMADMIIRAAFELDRPKSTS